MKWLTCTCMRSNIKIFYHELSITLPDVQHPARTSTLNIHALLLGLLLPFTAICGEIQPFDGQIDAQFSLPDLTDRQHSLSDYSGKVVLINFWASWCPPCIYELPELKRLQKRLGDRPFEIISLNVGEKKYKVRRFVKLVNFDLPVLLDTSNDTFNRWGVKTLPTSFLVGADGRIRYRVRGDPGWDNQSTLDVLEQLLSESAQSQAEQTTNTGNNVNDEANR